jgi:hypothetical protein
MASISYQNENGTLDCELDGFVYYGRNDGFTGVIWSPYALVPLRVSKDSGATWEDIDKSDPEYQRYIKAERTNDRPKNIERIFNGSHSDRKQQAYEALMRYESEDGGLLGNFTDIKIGDNKISATYKSNLPQLDEFKHYYRPMENECMRTLHELGFRLGKLKCGIKYGRETGEREVLTIYLDKLQEWLLPEEVTGGVKIVNMVVNNIKGLDIVKSGEKTLVMKKCDVEATDFEDWKVETKLQESRLFENIIEEKKISSVIESAIEEAVEEDEDEDEDDYEELSESLVESFFRLRETNLDIVETRAKSLSKIEAAIKDKVKGLKVTFVKVSEPVKGGYYYQWSEAKKAPAGEGWIPVNEPTPKAPKTAEIHSGTVSITFDNSSSNQKNVNDLLMSLSRDNKTNKNTKKLLGFQAHGNNANSINLLYVSSTREIFGSRRNEAEVKTTILEMIPGTIEENPGEGVFLYNDGGRKIRFRLSSGSTKNNMVTIFDGENIIEEKTFEKVNYGTSFENFIFISLFCLYLNPSSDPRPEYFKDIKNLQGEISKDASEELKMLNLINSLFENNKKSRNVFFNNFSQQGEKLLEKIIKEVKDKYTADVKTGENPPGFEVLNKSNFRVYLATKNDKPNDDLSQKIKNWAKISRTNYGGKYRTTESSFMKADVVVSFGDNNDPSKTIYVPISAKLDESSGNGGERGLGFFKTELGKTYTAEELTSLIKQLNVISGDARIFFSSRENKLKEKAPTSEEKARTEIIPLIKNFMESCVGDGPLLYAFDNSKSRQYLLLLNKIIESNGQDIKGSLETLLNITKESNVNIYFKTPIEIKVTDAAQTKYTGEKNNRFNLKGWVNRKVASIRNAKSGNGYSWKLSNLKDFLVGGKTAPIKESLSLFERVLRL